MDRNSEKSFIKAQMTKRPSYLIGKPSSNNTKLTKKKIILLSVELIHDSTVKVKAPIAKNSMIDFICYTQFHQRIVATNFVKNTECTFHHIQLLSLMFIKY